MHSAPVGALSPLHEHKMHNGEEKKDFEHTLGTLP